MSTPAEQQTFSWLRQIPGDLLSLDEKPLLGFPPAFSWEKFSEELNRSLQVDSIAAKPGNIQWRSKEELFAGLGDRLKSISLSINPLTGPVWWAIPEQGLVQLMELLLFKQSAGGEIKTLDDDFVHAFHLFLAAEALSAFEKTDFDKQLSPVVNQSAELPTESCLCLDVAIEIKQNTVYSRLFLSAPFRQAWMQRYLQQRQTAILSSPLADSLNIIVNLEAGKIDLKPSEWKQLSPGDFVLLDSCSLEPDEDKGRVMMVVNGAPLFRAKIKQGSLKILEHPLTHEVEKSMADQSPKEEGEEPEEEFKEEEEEEEEEDDDDDDEEEEEEEEEEDIDFDIDEEGEFELEEEESEIKKPSKEEKAAPPATPAPAPSKPSEDLSMLKTTSTGAPLSVDEIPLPVVIEIGRIQMSVKKLLELQPGNMLDLDIHPEAGVDMVVNGKRIAKGELLRIGDALGIRILELS